MRASRLPTSPLANYVQLILSTAAHWLVAKKKAKRAPVSKETPSH
jgi:hypothetical protein